MMRRTITTLLLLTIAGWSLRADAKRAPCSPMPEGAVKRWPIDGVWIIASDEGGKRRVKIARKDALTIRCVLERYLRSRRAARVVAKDFRRRLARWRMGAIDAAGPSIGSFWLSLGARQEIVLRATLQVRRGGRYGLVAKLRKQGRRWKVHSFSDWRAHRRRR